MASSDAELLQRWSASRDAEAFAKIVARHSGMVYATCRRLLKNGSDAEEVAQECFLELATKPGRVRRSVGGWLHAASLSRSLTRIKSEKRRRQREARYVERAAAATEASWNDVSEYVDGAIADLPEDLRELIVLRFLEGETQEAIAQRLDMPRSTVQYRLSRGIDQIRSALDRRGVSVASPALVGLLAANTAEAVPPALTAALGKVAVAGPTALSGLGAASTPTIIGGMLLMKKVVLALGIVAIAAGLTYWTVRPSDGIPSEPAKASLSAAVASQTPRENVGPPVEEQPANVADAARGNPVVSADRVEDAGQFGASPGQASNRPDNGETEDESPERESIHSSEIPADNGAHYFVLASELMPEIDRDWLKAKWEALRTTGWTDDPELLELLDACLDAMDAVQTGLAVGNTTMPLDRGPLPLTEWEPLQEDFNTLALVLCVDAVRHAALGNTATALDTYLTALDFTTEAQRGGGFGDAITGYGNNAVVTGRLRDALREGQVGPEACRGLMDHLLAAEDDLWTVSQSAVVEAQTLASWVGEGDSTAADVRAVLQDTFGSMRNYGELLQDVCGAPDSEVAAWFSQSLEDFGDLTEYLALPYYEAQDLDVDQFVATNPMGRLLLSHLTRLNWNESKVRAELRGTALMAAIELHQAEREAYPASLADLAPDYLAAVPPDPFTGEPFLYWPTDSGYFLYSTGSDMQDNGGITDGLGIRPGEDLVFHGP